MAGIRRHSPLVARIARSVTPWGRLLAASTISNLGDGLAMGAVAVALLGAWLATRLPAGSWSTET